MSGGAGAGVGGCGYALREQGVDVSWLVHVPYMGRGGGRCVLAGIGLLGGVADGFVSSLGVMSCDCVSMRTVGKELNTRHFLSCPLRAQS